MLRWGILGVHVIAIVWLAAVALLEAVSNPEGSYGGVAYLAVLTALGLPWSAAAVLATGGAWSWPWVLVLAAFALLNVVALHHAAGLARRARTGPATPQRV